MGLRPGSDVAGMSAEARETGSPREDAPNSPEAPGAADMPMAPTLGDSPSEGDGMVDNPSGDCQPDGDGSHPGYSVPGPSDRYLPDCQLTLKRSLWRVFVQPDGTAYVIPRPDAQGLRMGFCEGGEALQELFQTNGLCREAADPAVLNAMKPDAALRITAALHSRLRFEVVEMAESPMVEPFAPPADIQAACEILDEEKRGVVEAICVRTEQRLGGGDVPSIAIQYTVEEVRILAEGLNLAYGIEE